MMTQQSLSFLRLRREVLRYAVTTVHNNTILPTKVREGILVVEKMLADSYVRYQQLIGCNDLDLKNTTDLYARYTTSVICNSIVQNSVQSCKLNTNQSRPLCADTCVRELRSLHEHQLIIYRRKTQLANNK